MCIFAVNMKNNTPKWLYLLLLSVCLRFVYAYFVGDAIFEGDGKAYVQAAETLFDADFYPLWPPGMLYYLHIWIKIGGNHPIVFILAMQCIWVLTGWRLYQVVTRISNASAGLWALGIATFFPAFIHHSVSPLSQLPTALCLLGILDISTLLWQRPQSPLKYWLMGGIWLSMLVLLRPSNLLIAGIVPFFWLIVDVSRKPTWQTLRNFFVCMTVVGFWLGAWEIRAIQTAGKWVWINDYNSLNFYYGNNPHTPLYKTWWLGSHKIETDPQHPFAADSIQKLPPALRDPAYQQLAIAHIRQYPHLFVIRTLNRMRCLAGFDTFTGSALRPHVPYLSYVASVLDVLFYEFLLFVGLTFFLIPKSIYSFYEYSDLLRKLTLLIIACFCIPYFINFSHPTYHFPLHIFGIIYTSIGLSFLRTKNSNISPIRKFLFQHIFYLLIFLILIYIQIEWFWIGINEIR